MSKRPLTEAQKKASEKYVKANYDEIKVRVPKGNKIKIQNHATNQNESTSAFINRAIGETMERDNQVPIKLNPKQQELLTQIAILKASNESKVNKPLEEVEKPHKESLDEKLNRLHVEHSRNIETIEHDKKADI